MATREEIALPQDRIFVDGMQVGYVEHNPGKCIYLLCRVSEAEQAEIIQEVNEKFNRESVLVGPPKRTPVVQKRSFWRRK